MAALDRYCTTTVNSADLYQNIIQSPKEAIDRLLSVASHYMQLQPVIDWIAQQPQPPVAESITSTFAATTISGATSAASSAAIGEKAGGGGGATMWKSRWIRTRQFLESQLNSLQQQLAHYLTEPRPVAISFAPEQFILQKLNNSRWFLNAAGVVHSAERILCEFKATEIKSTQRYVATLCPSQTTASSSSYSSSTSGSTSGAAAASKELQRLSWPHSVQSMQMIQEAGWVRERIHRLCDLDRCVCLQCGKIVQRWYSWMHPQRQHHPDCSIALAFPSPPKTQELDVGDRSISTDSNHNTSFINSANEC
jgi:hypothetical protein